MGKPNIVLIFVDNQPAKMLGCAGNPEIHTPRLDALAARGTRFSEAFCPNAMCSPCRASVLTGLMPSQHGVHTWLDDSVPAGWPEQWNALDEFTTLPELLAANDYDTALIGKYHLGMADQPQNGFRYWVTTQIGHVQSFYNNKMIKNGDEFVYPGHSVEFFTDHAVSYLQERREHPDQPFFMFLTYPAPYGHWPSVRGEPDNQFGALYQDTAFDSVPREGISDQLIDWMLLRQEKEPDNDFAFYRNLIRIPNDLPTLRNYYSQMSIVDEGVGRVLDTLEESNQFEETLVIYTSDHGMSLGEHGFWGHGEDTWPSNTHREANHIPLIVKAPNADQQGAVSDHLVGTTDIYSTILDFTDLELPDTHARRLRSLRPLVESDEAAWEDAVFMEQEETRAIRTPQWLFMQRFQSATYPFDSELYDLTRDPDERVNRITEPEYREVVEQLTAQVDAFFATHSRAEWNLWQGGRVKSNSGRPFLWTDAWGTDWKPEF